MNHLVSVIQRKLLIQNIWTLTVECYLIPIVINGHPFTAVKVKIRKKYIQTGNITQYK